MARRLDDPALLAASLWAANLVHPSAEFPEESGRFIAEVERLCASDPSLGEELAGFRPWVVVPFLGLAVLFRFGRGGEVEPFLAEMRSRVGDSHNAFEQMLLHSQFTWVRAERGDVSGALEHGRQALEWATQSQNQALRVIGQVSRGHGLLSAGRLDEALEQLEGAVVLAIDRGFQKGFAASQGLPLLAETQLRRGEIGAARAAAERGIELARAMGYRHAEATNGIMLARALIASGDAAAAESALANASELATALAARDLPPLIEEARAELARRAGDAAACERALRTAARLHRENGEEWQATQAEAKIGA
jgi:ATP/maltotriose-dependent transcriptional regulator MalT